MVGYSRVQSVDNGNAILADGRTVRLGPLKDIAPGDYLEIYADIAIAKTDVHTAAVVSEARQGGHI